jgi:hypothetical protein
MYKQNTYKLQKTMKTKSTGKHNNKTCILKKEKQKKNNYQKNKKGHECSNNSKISTTINGTEVSTKGVVIARSDDVGTMQ